MRLLTLMALTFLLITLSPTTAQEPAPAAWPPEDPQALFGPDVEIIRAQLKIGNYPQEDGLFIDGWGAYPFPYGFLAQGGLRQLPDNRYYVGEQITNDGEVRWWLLDLENATWLQLRDEPQQVQTSCGSIPFRADQWTYVTGWVTIIGSNRQAHLCNLETGYRTPPLPNGYVESSWRVIPRDASDNLLFYTARRLNTPPEASVLFVQDMPAQEARELMAFRRDPYPYASDPRIGRLGETDYFLFNYPVPPTQNQRNHEQTALINLNQTTIIPVANDPGYEDNPARLVYRQETGTENMMQCEVRWMDVQTLQWTTYIVPSGCLFESRDDDEFYYRAISADGSTAQLMAADVLTGESRIVYEGEIEQVLGLLADERFIALVMNSNGRIDNIPRRIRDIAMSPDYEMWLIDLSTNRVVLKTPAGDCGYSGPVWCPIIKWLTDDLIALQSDGNFATTSLFSFSQSKLVISNIDGNLGGLVAGDWAYLYGNPQSEYSNIDLYNVSTQQRAHLVALTEADYWLSEVTYIGEDRFDITIGYDVEWMGGGENPLYNIITYRVRVNVPGL